MAITPLPPVPLRSDTPANFVTKADAFLGALNVFATETNAVGVALTLGATNATSTTSLTVGAGSKSLTVETGKSYVPGMSVKIASTASPSNWMLGDVTSYTTGTGALVVNVTDASGSGTVAAWTVSQSSPGAITTSAQQTQLYTAFATGGTSSAFTLTPVPAITSLIANQRFRVKFSLASTGAPTLAINGLTAALIKQYDFLGAKVTASVAAGQLVDVEYDGTDYVVLEQLPSGLKQIQPITASVATNALTCTLNPTSLDFRSSTLASGAVNTRVIGSAISLVVPSGASLGTIAAQTSRIAVIAIDNAGTVELAAANIAGGDNLDETTLLTTIPIAQTCTFTGSIAVTTGILTLSATGTGTFALGQAITGTGVSSGTYIKSLLSGTLGAAASTYQTNQFTAVASTTITGVAGMGVYSATARTGVPFRVVGYIESTQATAGTWATAPSTIQGMGGQALAAMSSLGYGQTWQVLTVGTTRVAGTTYYNTTGKPIIVEISAASPGAGAIGSALVINGVTMPLNTTSSVGGGYYTYRNSIIPVGASYNFTCGTSTLTYWSELR